MRRWSRFGERSGCTNTTAAAKGIMSTVEIGAARETYENAINVFSEVSGIMYRHAVDGSRPTQAEVDRYSKAEVALDIARRLHTGIWRFGGV